MLDFSRFSVNIFLTEAVFYIFSFFIGVCSALEINKIIAAKAEIGRLTADLPAGTKLVLPQELAKIEHLNAPELITIGQFMIAFLFATLFFILLIKSKYGARIVRFIFLLALFAGLQIIFRVWMSQELSIALALFFVAFRYFFPRVISHNLIIIAAITGIAVNLGMSIKPNEAILILIVISVYDFFAVYVSGHMVRMIKSSITLGTYFAMIIPQNFKHLLLKTSEVSRIKSEDCGKEAQGAFVYLGGGDLAFPLIMAIAALKDGLFSAVCVAVGALIGLLALNIIFMAQKERRPMAAMPPLAIFSILGYVASLIKF